MLLFYFNDTLFPSALLCIHLPCIQQFLANVLQQFAVWCAILVMCQLLHQYSLRLHYYSYIIHHADDGVPGLDDLFE